MGVILGVLIALHVLKPDVPQFLTSAHSHVNLLGAVMMLIFGVGYHILPRFSGRPLWNEGLAGIQFWMNAIGLAGMVISFIIAAYAKSDWLRYAVAPFGALYGIGALLFVINMWKTISGALPAPTPLKVPPAGGPTSPPTSTGK